MTIDTEIRFRMAADRAALAGDLTAAVVDLAARYHHDDGRPHRLVVASHPRPEETHDHTPRRPVTTPDVPLRPEFTVDLPATPQQVWEAVATADGITSWLMRTELEEHLGGAIVAYMGEGAFDDMEELWLPSFDRLRLCLTHRQARLDSLAVPAA